jgi:hypothetical protein
MAGLSIIAQKSVPLLLSEFDVKSGLCPNCSNAWIVFGFRTATLFFRIAQTFPVTNKPGEFGGWSSTNLMLCTFYFDVIPNVIRLEHGLIASGVQRCIDEKEG